MSEKSKVKLEYSTRAMIGELERWDILHPNLCIVKKRLFPSVIRRAARLMDSELDATFDIEALVPPDEKYLYGHMGKIREVSSQKYGKFILWNPDHQIGIRLGSFQEFQDNPCPKLVAIARGIKKAADRLGKIITDKGGTTIGFDMDTKQIGSGDHHDLAK
jgi:hypothetical protein